MEDDRDRFRLWIVFKPFTNVKPTHVRKIDIQQNRIRAMRCSYPQRLRPCRGLQNIESGLLKMPAERVPVCLIIVNEQDDSAIQGSLPSRISRQIDLYRTGLLHCFNRECPQKHQT
jgi:hypothetical protein